MHAPRAPRELTAALTSAHARRLPRLVHAALPHLDAVGVVTALHRVAACRLAPSPALTQRVAALPPLPARGAVNVRAGRP